MVILAEGVPAMHCHVVVLLIVFAFASVRAQDELKKPSQPGLLPGLAAHLYFDPVEWDGNWTEKQKPTVDPLAWTFRKYEATGFAPHLNYLFIQRGWFSARLVGFLQVPPGRGGQEKKGGEETYEFMLELWADDGVRLFLDGEKLIDDWRPCAETEPEAHRKVRVFLKAGGSHAVTIEYFQGQSLKKKDPDPLKLYWTCPDLHIPRQLVPASHFFHREANLNDYVPSQGLSSEDAKVLDGGKAAPKVEKGNLLESKTKR
jgi:hypothetical protein